MVFLSFLALFLIALMLLTSSAKAKSIYWLSTTLLCGSAGSFAVVLDEYIKPQFTTSSGMTSLFHMMYILFATIDLYLTPYAFVMFAICYSGFYYGKFTSKLPMILLIPVALLCLYPVYPKGFPIFRIEMIFGGLYILFGVILFLYVYLKEQNARLKRDRLCTAIVFIPPMLFILISDYISPLFKMDNLSQYEDLVVLLAVIVFFILIMNYGLIGMKLSLQYQERRLAPEAAIFQHVMKNNLGKIEMFSDRLKSRASKLTQSELESHVDVIEETSQHMQEMAERFKNRTGKVSVSMETVLINDIINENLLFLGPALKNISVNHESDNKICLECDREHIKEVINNILLNAIEAMPEGGGLYIRSYETKSKVVVEVQDSGIGIKQHHVSKVFEPYFTTKTNSGKNDGLGLPYCHKIVQKHGGKIKIESEPGKGTKVSLVFPKRKIF